PTTIGRVPEAELEKPPLATGSLSGIRRAAPAWTEPKSQAAFTTTEVHGSVRFDIPIAQPGQIGAIYEEGVATPARDGLEVGKGERRLALSAFPSIGIVKRPIAQADVSVAGRVQ